MTRVKICGLTNTADALAAVAAGADALGFVFATSPRRVEPDAVREIIAQLPPLVTTIGVFVNTPLPQMEAVRDRTGLDMIQAHGLDPASRPGRRIIVAQGVGPDRRPDINAFPTATLLLDTHVPGAYGGSGRTFDWNLARAAARHRPLILAGGLNADNVAQAIETVKPYAVDVSSGIESQPGRKDHEQLSRFIRRVKALG